MLPSSLLQHCQNKDNNEKEKCKFPFDEGDSYVSESQNMRKNCQGNGTQTESKILSAPEAGVSKG